MKTAISALACAAGTFIGIWLGGDDVGAAIHFAYTSGISVVIGRWTL